MAKVSFGREQYCDKDLIPAYWIRSAKLGIGKVCNRKLEPNGRCLNAERHANEKDAK